MRLNNYSEGSKVKLGVKRSTAGIRCMLGNKRKDEVGTDEKRKNLKAWLRNLSSSAF